MIKAVIFDYGGVLKKEFPLTPHIAELFDISVEDVKKFKPQTVPMFKLLNKGLISEDEFWSKVAPVFNKVAPENHKKLNREIYRKNFSLHKKVFALAESLKNRGLKVAILSNIVEFQADIIRENKGYDNFDVVVLSYVEKLSKPESDIYKLTIKKLDVKPEECIFVDDKEENLVPAMELGMKTVLAKEPSQIIKDVNSIINLENEKNI